MHMHECNISFRDTGTWQRETYWDFPFGTLFLGIHLLYANAYLQA